MTAIYGGLEAYRQFILYKKVWDEFKGKWNKIPCGTDGDAIDAHDVTKHISCDEATLCAQLLGDSYGTAFVFTKNDPFFFLDIDNALVQGQWSELATRLCQMFPTAYTEVSMSGTGLHIIGTYTQAMEHKCRNGAFNLEFYTEGRFMALGTAGRGSVTADCTPAYQQLITNYFNPEQVNHTGSPVEWTDKPEPGARPIPNDAALVQKAMLSTSGAAVFGGGNATFSDLWNANLPVLTACYPPQSPNEVYDASRADGALASHLLFWTGGDCARVDRLMRQSALKRDKWDRRGDDYIKRTVMGAKSRRGPQDYYRMTDEIIEVIEPCETAIKLSDQIKQQIDIAINAELGKVDGQQQFSLTMYPEAIDQIITRSFWSGTKSKLYVLSDEGALNMYREQDMIRLCQKHFGQMWEQQELDLALATMRALHIIDSTSAERELMKRIAGIGINIITDHLKMYNQRERLDVRVDMFATRPRVEWHPDKVTVVFTWTPIAYNPDDANQDIINDYNNHFPELDDMLRFIVASRFASNRKHFYTWLQCPSDWGKGFFTGILTELGVLVELSVAECEKAFEGAPLGRDASEFTRAFIVLFDEFKNIKSELKQLENTIPITPKNQLKQSVEVFTKLFTSAEGVESLAGESGVEDQFANRFSYIDGRGEINNRPLFNALGGSVYASAVTVFIAQRLNELVDEYVLMGKREAMKKADVFGREFHKRRNIDQKFERISSNIPNMVAEFRDWVIERYQPRAGITSCLLFDDGYYYLKSSSKIVGEWIEETASKSERYTLTKKKMDILSLLSDDGRGVTNHKPNGKSNKYVRFKLSP